MATRRRSGNMLDFMQNRAAEDPYASRGASRINSDSGIDPSAEAEKQRVYEGRRTMWLTRQDAMNRQADREARMGELELGGRVKLPWISAMTSWAAAK